MQLITIAPKIYNRTRPTHQSNTEHHIFTPNIFNHYKIMIDRQIIPDSSSVIRCLDPEMLEMLDSHGTFIIDEILEKIKEPTDPVFSREKIYNIFDRSRTRGSYSVRIQVERRGMREGIANSREWAEIASRKKAIEERA